MLAQAARSESHSGTGASAQDRTLRRSYGKPKSIG
jgi:hypothetical protein